MGAPRAGQSLKKSGVKRVKVASNSLLLLLMKTTLQIFRADTHSSLPLPLAGEGVKAGFPSPAEGYMADSIDLNRVLIRHKESTFYARVSGDSMIHAGIGDGDLVVIDKSLDARSGDYVVAYLDGEFTLKEFRIDTANQCGWLVPANENYSPIRVTADNEFLIWGVVTYVIRSMRK